MTLNRNEIAFGIIVVFTFIGVVIASIYVNDYVLDTLNKLHQDCILEGGNFWSCQTGEISCIICVLPVVIGAIIVIVATGTLLGTKNNRPKEESPRFARKKEPEEEEWGYE